MKKKSALTLSRLQSFRHISLSAALIASLLVASSVGCHRDPNVQKQKYLESGKRFANEGKYKEAAIQFANALKVDKNFAEAHYQLSKIYLKNGSPIQAFAELNRVVDLQPANLQARIDLGNLLLAGGQPLKAKEQADAVLASHPDDPDAFALLSAVAATQGDKTTALAHINKALSIDPNRAQFHTTLGVIQSSDPSTQTDAEAQLRKAIELDPKNASPRMVLARLLIKKGDTPGAIEQLKAAVAADPRNLIARSGLADLYLRQNDKAKAEETLRQATEDLADMPQGAEMLQNYYVATHQIDRGVADYAQLVEKHPKSAPLQIAYTRLLIAQKNYGPARDQIARLVKTDGGDPNVIFLNGWMMLNDGKTSEAFDVLQKGAKNYPDNVQIKLALGRAARAKGDLPTAEGAYHDATRLSPRNIEAQNGLAQVALDRHDFNLLAQVAEATIALAPQSSMPYVWRGISEGSQKNLEKAEADFQQAIRLEPRNSIAYFELAQVRQQQRKLPEAKALLQQALDANPNSSLALRNLVALDLVEKQPAKAIDRVKQQIQKSPNNSEFFDILADLQTMTGDPKSAIATAEQGMKLNPADDGAVMAYTRAQVSNRDTGKAVESWETWTKSHPTDSRAYAILGTLQEAQGNKDQAIAAYKKSLAIQPEQAVAANNLAYLMLEGGENVDVALTLAQTARRILPNSPNTADTLAWAYYHKGTYASARDLLEDALKVAPNDPAMHYHLGMVYSKLANKPDAELHLKKAQELAPNSQTAKDAAKELSSLT
ncbi:MAG TPA: tetratricopeptide repeat protein [Edaphobacter sp.]